MSKPYLLELLLKPIVFAIQLFPLQESGEFAEGVSSRTLPLRVSALPPCRPAESPDSHSTLRPALPPPPILHTRRPPRAATPNGTVPYPNLPAQPSRDTSAHLSQPQPDTTAAMAVAPGEDAEGTHGDFLLLLVVSHRKDAMFPGRHKEHVYSCSTLFYCMLLLLHYGLNRN